MRRILPAVIVGAVVVGTAELAHSLLLSARPGFLRALTVVLAVQLVSLAVGIATGPRRVGVGSTWTAEAALALRWRWLLSVAALGITAVAAGGWTLLSGFGGTPTQRGVAVASLAALPLLVLGGVVSGLVARSPHLRVGAWMLVGGAAGAVGLGLALPRVAPPSVLLGATILVSAAALVDGRVDRKIFAAADAADDILPVSALAPDPLPPPLPVEALAPDRLAVS